MHWNPENILSLRLLLVVTLAEAALGAAAAASIFVHGAWIRRREAADAERLSRGRAIIFDALNGSSPDQRQMSFLRKLSPRLSCRLFLSMARIFRLAEHQELTALAEAAGILKLASRLCRDRRWWLRLRGAKLHTELGGGEETVFSLIRDRSRDVRTQAIEWAAQHPDPEVISALLDALDRDDATARFTVTDALRRIRARVIQPLARRLAEDRHAPPTGALRVAAGLWDPILAPPALRLCSHASPEVRALAAAVVTALGGEEVAHTLDAMLKDVSAGVRKAAARGLGRLQRWESATSVAPLLGDPAWEVRREAGLALCAMGPAGRLLLSRVIRGGDSLAADAARYAESLPPQAQVRLS